MPAGDKSTEAGGERSFGPKNVLKFGAILVGAFLLSNFVSSFFDSGETGPSSGVSWMVIVPAMIVAVFLTLSLHEVGHLIGGKLSGGRILLFIVGPLRLQATANGLRPFLNRSIAMAGGIAGTVPTNSSNLRRQMSLMTAGGPVMSFVVAALAYGLSTFSGNGFVNTLSFALALMSALIGAVTLLPVSNGGFKTDGMRLLMLYRGGAEAERWCAIAALGGASVAGERPREWDEGLIRKSLSPEDGSLDDVGASLNAAYHALDLGRTDEAERLLTRAAGATDIPGAVRSQTLLELAFFYAFFRGDAIRSRDLYSQVRPGEALEKHQLHRTGAAVLLREGNEEEAREKARLALKELDLSMSPGTARLEREWLEDIEADHSKPNTVT